MSRIVVLGDINLDVLARVPGALPTEGEVRTEIGVEAGGSAANFARCAAGMGASVEFVGCIGDDVTGAILAESLRSSGVTPHLQQVTGNSGTVVSLARPDGRMFLCSRGANDGLSPAWLKDEWFTDADHLHLSGYAFLSPRQRQVAMRALALARMQGLTISIDPPPANLIASLGPKVFLDMIGDVDVLFPNLVEGQELTGETPDEKIVEVLSARFACGVLTLGENGSLAWRGDKRIRHSVTGIEDVDPTGAGDAFAAAFVVTYLDSGDLDLAGQRGTAAAATMLRERAGKN